MRCELGDACATGAAKQRVPSLSVISTLFDDTLGLCDMALASAIRHITFARGLTARWLTMAMVTSGVLWPPSEPHGAHILPKLRNTKVDGGAN